MFNLTKHGYLLIRNNILKMSKSVLKFYWILFEKNTQNILMS